MDSSRKRRAPPATPSSDSRSVKKIKLLNTNHVSDNDKTPQKVGLRLITQLHNAADKTGRPIIGAFKTLPQRNEHPDYYEQTKLPLALDVIEAKLQRDVYPTVSSVESDFKRMIQNAKDYNMPKSDVYEDAERIRKLVYNFMKTNNPAYQLDPSYSAFPTPIPTHKSGAVEDPRTAAQARLSPTADDHGVNGRSSTRSRGTSIKLKRSGAADPDDDAEQKAAESSPDAEVPEAKKSNAEMEFDGQSFQDVQQMIIAKLIEYTDEDGLEIFTPFINLPPRSLEDYYKVIRHPVSLKGVQKRTKGQHGRNAPTGITDFKTWDAFEEEVSHIWHNAKEYNEDGSEMFELATELEARFKRLMNDARGKVDEPAGTRIKLGASKPKSGITLNLTQHRHSPPPRTSADAEVPSRARQTIQSSQPSHESQSTAANKSQSTPQVPPVEVPRPQSSVQDTTPANANAVKSEKLTTASPAPNGAPPIQAIPTIAPGSIRAPGASPLPPPPLPNSTLLAPPPPFSGGTHYIAPALLPPTPIRPYPVSQAMLTAATLSSHASLEGKRPYSLVIQPHEVLSHQSLAVTLPAAYHSLDIAPTIAPDLVNGRRLYKLFVTVNGTRLSQRDTHLHVETGRRTHMYGGNLALGVNRVEIEVAASSLQNRPENKGLDLEKMTVFVNLIK